MEQNYILIGTLESCLAKPMIQLMFHSKCIMRSMMDQSKLITQYSLDSDKIILSSPVSKILQTTTAHTIISFIQDMTTTILSIRRYQST